MFLTQKVRILKFWVFFFHYSFQMMNLMDFFIAGLCEKYDDDHESNEACLLVWREAGLLYCLVPI